MATEQANAPSISVIAIPLRHRPRRDRAGHLWRTNPALIMGISLVSCVIVLAIIGPYVAPYDPTKPNYAAAVQAPSLAHPFGTEEFGRDQFSRVLYGARIDLAIGVIATVVPLLIGVVVGCLAGYHGGVI